MTLYVIYFAVFLGVVLVTTAVGNRMMSGTIARTAVNRRMQVLERTAGLAGLEQIRLERGLDEDGTLGRALVASRRLYMQSGVVAGWPRLFLVSAAVSLAPGFLAGRLFGSDTFGLLVFLAVLCAGPFAYLRFRRDRRIRAFAAQLPEAIDVIVRSLQAGHPLTTSLALVGSEMPDPVGTEFGILNDELTYGTDLGTALRNLQDRMPAEDLSMFALTVMIQRTTGGNLAEILETLSTTIRERQMLRLKVRALTAEGRFSAIFMTVFPFLVYFVLRAISPDYFAPLWDSNYGSWVFGGCLFAMAMGNLIMRRMVNFRV
jgi:tight adherence protein B